jgi:uncharacterized protein YpmB
MKKEILILAILILSLLFCNMVFINAINPENNKAQSIKQISSNKDLSQIRTIESQSRYENNSHVGNAGNGIMVVNVDLVGFGNKP